VKRLNGLIASKYDTIKPQIDSLGKYQLITGLIWHGQVFGLSHNKENTQGDRTPFSVQADIRI
jgi:hypothetical protein